MARYSLVLLLTVVLMGQAYAAKNDACLLVLKVQPKQSQYKLSGAVTKPIKGKVPEVTISAVGSLYLRLPDGPACPPPITAESLPTLLAGSRLAAPPDLPGLTFDPEVIHSKIANTVNNKTIADWILTRPTFGLHSSAPLGPGTGAAAGAESCLQLVFINGSLRLESFVGPRTADVRALTENRTMAVVTSVTPKAGPPKTLTLTVLDATFTFDISPEKTPGVSMTEANYKSAGNAVTVADLTNKTSFIKVDASTLDWNAKPRLLQPTIKGGEDPNPAPAYVPATGAPGQCQVAAAPGNASADPAPAAAGTAGAAAAPAAAAAAPKSWAAGRATGGAAAAVAAAAAVLMF